MSDQGYEFPEDCRYTESDEWIRLDATIARVGITDYAQSELSDVVFVELPEVGTQVEANEAFGVVESVKAVSDLLAPVAGEITDTNSGLEDNPEWVNEDPYGQGWMIALAPEELEEVERLMSADEYRKYVEGRARS